MLVGERMTRPVITVKPDLPIQEALQLMKREHIRRLPVVDAGGKLVGIVAERDLLEASPSDATTLSVWELNYLLSKITVGEVMSREVVTVTEDTPLEEAARVMIDRKIGALPVVRGDDLIGIITETDLFKIFLELFGARQPGIRITVEAPDVPGELAKLTGAIYEAGGNIIALGTFQGESADTRHITIKVEGVEADKLRQAVEPYVERVVDVREMEPA